MDADLKAQADALFTELGMNLTTAFNIFVLAIIVYAICTKKTIPVSYTHLELSLPQMPSARIPH